MPKEIWKAIDGFGGYEVSTHGRVRSLDRTVRYRSGIIRTYKGKMLQPGTDKDGYQQVNLCRSAGKKTQKIHRLVLFAFAGNPPRDNHEVNHLDGNKANNYIDNLEWTTSGDNQHHAYITGLRQDKLSLDDANTIRAMYSSGGCSYNDLGKIFGVSKVMIGKIIRDELWIDG